MYIPLFCSAFRLKKLVSSPLVVPEFDSDCFGRDTGETENVVQSTNRDGKSSVHHVDVNRFFLASDHADAAGRYVDEKTGVGDDNLTVTSYLRLDVVRITLVIVDFIIVLHRCVCLGCCSCCWRRDGHLIAEAGAEVVRNGVAGSGFVQCPKHDETRQQRKHRAGRAPNGSVSRPLSSFDVYDDEEDADHVPDALCPLHRRRRGKDASIRASVRRRIGGGLWQRRWTQEQRRRRRQLTSLLTILILCSIVVSLLYIVIRSLDVILVELLAIATKQLGANDLLVTEAFLSKTFAHQVGRTVISC